MLYFCVRVLIFVSCGYHPSSLETFCHQSAFLFSILTMFLSNAVYTIRSEDCLGVIIVIVEFLFLFFLRGVSIWVQFSLVCSLGLEVYPQNIWKDSDFEIQYYKNLFAIDWQWLNLHWSKSRIPQLLTPACYIYRQILFWFITNHSESPLFSCILPL